MTKFRSTNAENFEIETEAGNVTQTISGALVATTDAGGIDLVSGALYEINGAQHTHTEANITDLGDYITTTAVAASYATIAYAEASFALKVDVAASLATIDGHIADSSDPHGALLSQTNIVSTGIGSFAIIKITGDQAASNAIYCPAFIYDTAETPPTASNYPIGSIYVQYTP